MGETIATTWRPGTDLPLLIPWGPGRVLATLLPAAWLKQDRSGRPLLLPPAVRFVDRLRATFGAHESLSPGFIVSLREALGLTLDEFARTLKVAKMTVSRWERGRMRPSESAVRSIRKLQHRARRRGVLIDGEKKK